MSVPITPPPSTRSTSVDRAIVAVAWPTGRPIYAYTIDEIAAGVDVYTQRLKAKAKAMKKAGGRRAR